MIPPRRLVGFGSVSLATLPTKGAARRLLRETLSGGIDYIDTAPIYSRGLSERLLGSLLGEIGSGARVATKFGLGRRDTPPLPLALIMWLRHVQRSRSASPALPRPAEPAAGLPARRSITHASVRAEFAASQRALRRRRIDVYLLHEAAPAWLEESAWDFLRQRRDAGDIGLLGVATGAHHLSTLQDQDLTGWDVVQYERGPGWPDGDLVAARFPDQIHVVHSSLRRLPAGQSPTPERLRTVATSLEPGTRLLFSTTASHHLRANLAALLPSDAHSGF